MCKLTSILMHTVVLSKQHTHTARTCTCIQAHTCAYTNTMHTCTHTPGVLHQVLRQRVNHDSGDLLHQVVRLPRVKQTREAPHLASALLLAQRLLLLVPASRARPGRHCVHGQTAEHVVVLQPCGDTCFSQGSLSRSLSVSNACKLCALGSQTLP